MTAAVTEVEETAAAAAGARPAPALSLERARQALAAAPGEARSHFALGMAHARLGQHEEAAAAMRSAVELDAAAPAAWRALGDQLTLLDDRVGADAAYAQAIRASIADPRLMESARALCEGRLAIAEQALRAHLYRHPTDVAAIRMLAEVGARLGRFEDAEKLLARCLELSPSFMAARHNYAIVLHRQSKSAEALEQLDRLLAADPDNPSYLFLRASTLARIGEYDAAIAIYRGVLQRFPDNARAWLSLGHALKTAGDSNASIAAYGRSIDIEPQFGEAYWSLANMKTYRFDAGAAARMQAQLARSGLSQEDRFHLHFALGKALEDEGDYDASFRHYSEGARLRREGLSYSAEDTTRLTDRQIEAFSQAFLEARAGAGAAGADPIFVVGLPRAGSTLVEQILSSHSAVEGTMELPDIAMMAKRIGGGRLREGAYPEALRDFSPAQVAALGEEYLARTRIQRKTGAPFFIDKMPNNFQHLGMIHLMLPNAKIVDARRHPMACCFSAFKQHFARGQAFSYDLEDLGRYYADYVRLMRHFAGMLPGRVHRVQYEDMIADPEAEIRRLLDYCGLPFERACLEFHANDRAVRTASSEQVRRPIYSEALEHWRNFEPWLAPLRASLGDALERYREV